MTRTRLTLGADAVLMALVCAGATLAIAPAEQPHAAPPPESLSADPRIAKMQRNEWRRRRDGKTVYTPRTKTFQGGQ